MVDNKERRRRQAATKEGIEVNRAITVLLADPTGRTFLWWMLEQTGLNRNPFTNNALATSFACGEMNVGQKYLARILEADSAGYVRMLQEKQNGRTDTLGSDGNTDDVDGYSSDPRDPDGAEDGDGTG